MFLTSMVQAAEQPSGSVDEPPVVLPSGPAAQVQAAEQPPGSVTFASLIPIPHRDRPSSSRPRVRKKHPSYEITSPECIAFVEERSLPKRKKRKLNDAAERTQIGKGDMKPTKGKGRGMPVKGKEKSDKSSTGKKKTMTGKIPGAPPSQTDNTKCLYCEIMYSESHVAWVRCQDCLKWACEQCARVGKKKKFICDSCKA